MSLEYFESSLANLHKMESIYVMNRGARVRLFPVRHYIRELVRGRLSQPSLQAATGWLWCPWASY